MEKFSERIRKKADPIWQDNFNHPFIKGLADGTLPIESFKYYVLQDSYYLSHFARIQCAGGAKAEDFYTTSRMAIHAQGSYEAEMALHEKFSKMLNISAEEFENFMPAPSAYAYTSHLYRVAYNGNLGEIISALLPCYWVYLEIGDLLQGATPKEEVYQEWIAAYGGDWFRDLVNEQIDRLDEIAEKVTEKDRNRMEEHFLISSHYEYAFWDMAYNREDWTR
ncbi:thiaminase II [Salipaludibacillus sp. CF4.18]|uniref:thiaminase II n=1 Tax=Salipaludibacillus sp. CF4.18 TaxID=3373081 RepID=UPI003EE605AC